MFSISQSHTFELSESYWTCSLSYSEWCVIFELSPTNFGRKTSFLGDFLLLMVGFGLNLNTVGTAPETKVFLPEPYETWIFEILKWNSHTNLLLSMLNESCVHFLLYCEIIFIHCFCVLVSLGNENILIPVFFTLL